MQRDILIICDAFPPDFAPRMGYLCRHLDAGYRITVVAAKEGHTTWPIDIQRENFSVHQIQLTSRNRFAAKLQNIGDYLFSRKDRKLCRCAKQLLKGRHFDLVLCLSYYIFPLLCGEKIAQHFNIPLCVDLRDIMEQFVQPVGFQKFVQFFKLRWINNIRRNRILRNASAVTTVSPWHVDVLRRYNSNTHLIYNGFDADVFKYKEVRTDYFTITYTGRVLDLGLRNPTLLFEALQTMCKDEVFAKALKIRWFVDEVSMRQVSELSERYHLQHCTEISRTVSADRMPDILNESSIVVVLTNKATERGPHGIMTTKFFEALGCEKPVLCVRSDEECLAQVIGQSKAGVAARNVGETIEFIKDKFDEWKANGFTHQQVDAEAKAQFSRQSEARQFAEVMEGLIKN
ncbi:MAG: glycosyltransferase [Bacteroidales bacterium]|nr:glycosyltransferase [Bacteroidales bacterium]